MSPAIALREPPLLSRHATTDSHHAVKELIIAWGPTPAPLHDGIDDQFIEKGSVVWYWRQGQWLRLPGRD